MANTYSLDYETSSACDIKRGGYRYASDPSTRILMFAIARNSEPPVLWDHLTPNSPESMQAKALLKEADATDCEVHAFNAAFEIAITRYRLYKDVGMSPICMSKWRCVQALTRVASIPVSLAAAATLLRVEDKDPVGKALIGVFSIKTKQHLLRIPRHQIPNRQIGDTLKVADPLALNPIPWDHTFTVLGKQVSLRDAWEMFKDYCRKDVIVERQVRAKLDRFKLSESELEGYQFTCRMNDIGAPLNVSAVNNAAAILETHREYLETRFKEITGLAPSQTSKTLAWLQHHGYPGDNLQSKTMKEWTGSSFLSLEGQEALAIRSALSFAAIKKIATMQESVCPDGTAKGMFTWFGASATGRWTSQGIQLQNARKPTIDNPDIAYRLIRDGADAELMEICFGNPYEAVASCIRNFVQPHEGGMYAVDYSNIESRVAAWLAGQEDLLDVYREGRDAYKELAARVFNVPLDEVTKDQRFVGKVGNLSLVFQTGAKTFHETCAMWGNPIPKQVACDTVKTFREVNHHFPKTWRAYEAASVKAIQNPGKWFEASPHVSFACSVKAPFHRLVMRLPSGRQLCYPIPKVQRTVKKHTDYETGQTREWDSDDITYYGQRTGQVLWGRVNLYAGLLFQNSVQATARDIMQHGCVNAAKKGYEIFSVIHDEVLSYEHPDGWVGLSAALCEHPAWLPADFPLSATGGRCDYYTKD